MTSQAKPCAGGCRERVRPKGTSLDDWPGTLMVIARGMCHACYNKAPRQTMKVKGVVSNCLGCERPIRDRRTTVAEQEGTVAHYTAGRCKSCHKLHTEQITRQLDRRPERCRGCNEKLRPKLRSSREFPGTVAHNGKGLCATCKSRVDRGVAPTPTAPLPVRVVTPTPRTEFVEDTEDMALNRMMQERAARKNRQVQVQAARARQEAIRQRFLERRRQAA